MKISDIKKASYNPRKMNKEARAALRHSLQSFDDISGIVVNQRTGNIIAGNHRWEELLKHYGKKNVSLTKLTEDFYSLDTKEKATGFLIRIVDWDEAKEKAANITANNDLIQGEFTSGLQNILSDLQKLDFPEMDFSGLRLDELKIDLNGIDEDLDWDDEAIDQIQAEAEERNNALPDAKGKEPSNVKEIISEIKISVPDELKEEVKDDLLEFLAAQYYYGQITIV